MADLSEVTDTTERELLTSWVNFFISMTIIQYTTSIQRRFSARVLLALLELFQELDEGLQHQFCVQDKVLIVP